MASSLVGLALRRNAFPAIRKAVFPTTFPAIKRALCPPRRFISTSGNNKDTITATHGSHVDHGKVESLEDKEENWISYGYDLVDRDVDEYYHHSLMFVGITIVTCGALIFYSYYPDFRNEEWSHREACLELERREKAGLPLIDRNLIDPAKIDLPSDEELGDYDIII